MFNVGDWVKVTQVVSISGIPETSSDLIRWIGKVGVIEKLNNQAYEGSLLFRVRFYTSKTTSDYESFRECELTSYVP